MGGDAVNGIVNFLKPPGMTSSDAVTIVRRILNERHCGHMGTLDPGAAGVLLIGAGKASRLFDFFLAKRKRYRAEFTFGAETDTLDAYGTVTRTDRAEIGAEAFERIRPDFTGELEQLPPKFSAVKIGGRKAYELARGSVDFELKSRTVTVYRIDFLGSPAPNVMALDILCSGGTYIRSLARDMAAALGTVGYMSSLIRTECGEYAISQSLTEQELRECAERGDFSFLRSPASAVASLARFEVPGRFYEKLCNGIPYEGEAVGKRFSSDVKKVPEREVVDRDAGCEAGGKAAPNSGSCDVAVWCRGEFFGIGERSDGTLKIKTYLKD